jgi:NADPH2:quinone reductase
MKCVMVDSGGGPEVIQLNPTAEIPKPGTGEVRVAVAYAPLNPLDTHARGERIAWNHPGFPFVPGFEFCGRIESVGKGVEQALIGKRVAASASWGGNAEFALAQVRNLTMIPDSFDWKLGATFSTCAYTAWHLINSAAQVKPGQVVVVHSAAGAVGSLTMQIARDRGAKVIGLASSTEKLAFAEAHGANHAIDYTQEDWPERVKDINDDCGADVIIDGNAGPNAQKNYDAIAPLGKIIYLGAMGGQAADVNVSMLIGKSISVMGFVQYFYQAQTGGAENAEINKKLTDGSWVIPIGKIYELEEVAEAHRAFEARELMGRTLIRVGGDAI